LDPRFLHFITPSQEYGFYHNCNPVHCSLESLRLRSKIEKIGLRVANHHLSFVALAHLYNAVQQKGLLNHNWVQMEDTINLQIAQLFVGGELPTMEREMLQRFVLAMGYKAWTWAKDGYMNSRKTASMKQVKKELMPTEMSEALQRYF